MAKVATPSSVPPRSHRIGLAPPKGSMVKRKTPSELRVSSIYLHFDLNKCSVSVIMI